MTRAWIGPLRPARASFPRIEFVSADPGASLMKRTFAVVALLAALGILSKLAMKEAPRRVVRVDAEARVDRPSDRGALEEAELRARYPAPADRALVDRTLDRYRQTALAIERTDGLRGLALLDTLDIEAIQLYEKYPDDFRRLRDSLTDGAAAEILLHWREYFGLKRADETDRSILIAEIARLTPAQRKVAARFPGALPMLLADPAGVAELASRESSDPAELADALALLEFVSLESGSADLRAALRTLDDHGPLALQAFRVQGLDGFALVGLYGPVLAELGEALPLDQALILLRVNTGYVDELLRGSGPEAVAAHLRHVAAAGLVDAVGGSPHALRLVVEHGTPGERALREAGADAADVVYESYADPVLRNQAVIALAEHGPMALAMLDKYADDPDFREILRRDGAGIIPPIARSDAGPETLAYLRSKTKRSFTEGLAQSVLALSGDNGQATIRLIQADGLERVAELESSDVRFQQFLPLYDLIHLGNVIGRGQSPTSGEMTWALVDGCFVVVDALSLAAVQPEGVVAAEAARSEVKAAVGRAARSIGRELAEDAGESAGKAAGRRGAEAAAERLSRWWAVRSAGGTYRVLRRLPEALPKLGLAEIADLGRPLCAKAGLRLSTWAPVRFLRNGAEVVMRIPPDRGLKYLGVQAVQASVGVVGFHKMEEHLASRRPQTQTH